MASGSSGPTPEFCSFAGIRNTSTTNTATMASSARTMSNRRFFAFTQGMVPKVSEKRATGSRRGVAHIIQA